MARPDAQRDIFAEMPDLIPPRRSADIPTPEYVRAQMLALLATARAADRLPWDSMRLKVKRTIFHNMGNWLPKAEASALRAAFIKELERLGVAD
jgi:hypothetical protein